MAETPVPVYPRIDAVGVLLVQVRKPNGLCGLLAIRRGDGAGWALPGGYLEPGETLERCGLRELAEETGLIAPDAEQCTLMHSVSIAGGSKLLVFSVARFELSESFVRSRFVPSSEATDWRIVHDGTSLCYPTHQQAARDWFARFHSSTVR